MERRSRGAKSDGEVKKRMSGEVVVDSAISMMSVLLWIGFEVVVEINS